MKLMRLVALLMAIMLSNNVLAQTECVIKDKTNDAVISSSSSVEFTFGDSFLDRFDVSGKSNGPDLAPEDFILMLYSAGNEPQGMYALDDPIKFEPGLNMIIRLKDTEGNEYPADGGFKVHLNKRVLSIKGDGYYISDKNWDGTVAVTVDLQYANENLEGALKDDNIKVEFDAEYSNPDADNEQIKTIYFTNIKVTGNNVNGYEFNLTNKKGFIFKNTEMSENIYWRLEGKNKRPNETLTMYYGKTVGTGGTLYAQIDNVTGYASYYAFPYFVITNVETGDVVTITASDDPYMIPVGLYTVKAVFDPVSHLESFDPVVSERKLIVNQNKLKIVPPPTSEYTYGESQLGYDIAFKAQTQDNSVLPGTWKYFNILDSTWYEHGQMLDSGVYKFKAYFTAINHNFGEDSSAVGADIIVHKRALKVRVPGPFVTSDKYYDSTTNVIGLDINAANDLDVLSGFAVVNGRRDNLSDVYISNIDAQYVGADAFTPNQAIKLRFTLDGPKAKNYKINDIPNYPGRILPLPILVKLNSADKEYGTANLWEDDLKPYFVLADDPDAKVPFDVEAEAGSRWYLKSNTVSPLVGPVADGYYNTGAKPLHLDAVTHKITACFKTGDQTNFAVQNNILNDDNTTTTISGFDESVINVSPVKLTVKYRGKIMKVYDGNVSVIPSDVHKEKAYGIDYRYDEDSTVFVVNGFIDITQDPLGSKFDSPELGKHTVYMWWTLDHGTRIAENYYAKELYDGKGLIVDPLFGTPGHSFYDIVWNYHDDIYYDQYNETVTMPYGSTIGTVRPLGDERINYDLCSEWDPKFAAQPYVLETLPTYEYSVANGPYQKYVDGTVLPVGTYNFRATFASTDPEVDNIASIKVIIKPLELMPVVTYEREKYYDGNTKVKVLSSELIGLLPEDAEELILDYSISFSDFNSGNRSISLSYTIEGDRDVLKNYILSKTSDIDDNGFIHPIQPSVVWKYEGQEVTADTLKIDPAVGDGTVFKTDIIANLEMGDFASMFNNFSGPVYEDLIGNIPANNVLTTGIYNINATYNGINDGAVQNFIDASASIIIEVAKLKIKLIEQHLNRQDDGIFPYGSRIGTEIKMVAENDQAPKSKIVYYYYMDDYEYPTEPLPVNFVPNPGKHTITCEAVDRNNYMISSRKTIEIEIGPNPVVIAGDLKVQTEKVYDGSDSAHVISNGLVLTNIGNDDVELSVVAKYDTPEAGIHKVITYTVSISGKDAVKYVVPKEYINHVYKTDGDELGVITPLPINLDFNSAIVTYGESVLGKDIAAVVTPDGIEGKLTYDIKDGATDIEGTKMLTVGDYQIKAKFMPTSPNYKGFITEYVDVTVNPKRLGLVGDLVIESRYEDGTTVVYDNQYSSEPVLGDGVLDGDKVTLVVDKSQTAYPVANAGKDYPISVRYNLDGEDAFNYTLWPKRIEVTSDINVFKMPDPENPDDPDDPNNPSDPDDPNDPNNPGKDPNDPNAGGNGGNGGDGDGDGDKVDPNDPTYPGTPNGNTDGDGYEIWTRVYGPQSVLTEKLIDRSFKAPLTVKCIIDDVDRRGEMLVPQDEPYYCVFQIFQNDFMLHSVKTKIYIQKRHLGTTPLNFPHSKVWDGTVQPTSWDIPMLTNVVAEDKLGAGSGVNLICDNAIVQFDNPNVGTGKTISAEFVLSGTDWQSRYYAPANINYDDGVITKANIDIKAAVDPAGYCAGDQMSVSFDYKCPGSPVLSYTITFAAEDITLGFQDIDNAFASSNSNQHVMVPMPDGLSYGNHSARVRFSYSVGNEVQAEGETSFDFLTNYTSSLIHDKFQDVVLIDNSSFKFVGYEWYKDNTTLADETKQFFNDKPYLYGWYGAYVTTVDNQKIKVCPAFFDHRPAGSKKAVKTVNVYPNPAYRMETVTIDLSDFEDEDFSNAEIVIYSSLGVMVQRITNVEVKNFVNLPADSYTGNVVFGDKKLSFKLIVRD